MLGLYNWMLCAAMSTGTSLHRERWVLWADTKNRAPLLNSIMPSHLALQQTLCASVVVCLWTQKVNKVKGQHLDKCHKFKQIRTLIQSSPSEDSFLLFLLYQDHFYQCIKVYQIIRKKTVTSSGEVALGGSLLIHAYINMQYNPRYSQNTTTTTPRIGYYH